MMAAELPTLRAAHPAPMLRSAALERTGRRWVCEADLLDELQREFA